MESSTHGLVYGDYLACIWDMVISHLVQMVYLSIVRAMYGGAAARSGWSETRRGGQRTERRGRPKRGDAAHTRTDCQRCNGGDDEGGEADDEDMPSRAAAPGAGRSRAPERYRRDSAMPRR